MDVTDLIRCLIGLLAWLWASVPIAIFIGKVIALSGHLDSHEPA